VSVRETVLREKEEEVRLSFILGTCGRAYSRTEEVRPHVRLFSSLLLLQSSAATCYVKTATSICQVKALVYLGLCQRRAYELQGYHMLSLALWAMTMDVDVVPSP
jgi:hypothetical protein